MSGKTGVQPAKSALTVTAPGGRTDFLVMNEKDPIPSSFALKATNALRKVALRIGGGCSGMDANDKRNMVEYFDFAFKGYLGVIFSGGTRQRDGDSVDLMVTEIPGIVAASNPGSVALGSLPRTSPMSFQDESVLTLDESGTTVNVAMAMVLMVQAGPEGELGWNGDLDAYFALMQQWQNYAGFTAVGGVFWNGGGVTKEEIIRCAKSGFVTIVVKGSGRAADEIAGLVEAQDEAFMGSLPLNHRLIIVDRSDPGTLRQALVQNGFITED